MAPGRCCRRVVLTSQSQSAPCLRHQHRVVDQIHRPTYTCICILIQTCEARYNTRMRIFQSSKSADTYAVVFRPTQGDLEVCTRSANGDVCL